MIRTILFDMGNVLVSFSHERMCAQIGSVCGLSAGAVRRLLIDSGLQWKYERGELTEAGFHAEWQAVCGRRVSRGALVRAGSDIFQPMPGILPLLDELHGQGLRLVLLSNTCRSHLEMVRRQFSVLDRFHALVTSCEVGALKPSEAIYRAAIEQIACPPEECFYIDDIPQYVAAGRAQGLQAEVFCGADALRRELVRRQVLSGSASPTGRIASGPDQ